MDVRNYTSRTTSAELSRHYCGLFLCGLPIGLSPDENARLDRVVEHRHRLKRGEYLCRAGADLAMLYAVSSGCLKSSVTDESGREQIGGFHMSGELVGMDAIAYGKNVCNVVALESAEVCGIPHAELGRLTQEIPSVQRQVNRMMSREIVRERGLLFLLGSMTADERVAVFLLNLGERFAARGFSKTRFTLSMTRNDIGSYLGLRLETVSRIFSKLRKDRVISMDCKEVHIDDPDALRAKIGDYQQRRSPIDGGNQESGE